MKTVQLLLAFTLLSAFAAANDHNPNASDLTANPVYEKNCAKCHGKTAEGRHFGGPSLISDKTAAASDDELRAIIGNGKGHMPKFGGKLGGGEIDALIAQIKKANAK